MKKLFPTFFAVVFLAILARNLWGAEFCVTSSIDLQTYLEVAESNDENDVIKIQQGLYTGNFKYASAESDKNITILGGYTANCSIRVVDPSNTVLQGNGDITLSFLVVRGGDIIIDGLTLKKGNTSIGNGGGLYAGCSSSVSGNPMNITVTNNIISGNSAMQGGGISLLTTSGTGDSGNITIKNNIISENSVEFGGGGIDAQSTSYAGASGNILVENNIIKMNAANTGGGGGLSVLSRSTSGLSGDIRIMHNTISDNSAVGGGGLFVGQSGPQPGEIIIKYNLISGNISGSGGGGGVSASCGIPAESCDDIIITDNLITDNISWAGGGVDAISLGDVIITNNTIYNNTASYGGGIWFLMGDSDLYVYNNIIWGNSSDSSGGDITIQISGSPAGSSYGYNNDYSVIYGSWTNSGNNINKAPLFSNAPNRDFHLANSSPCIDAGINKAPKISNVDFEGNLRIHDGDNNGTATVDMGAYEYGSDPPQNAAKAMPWIPLLLLDN